VITELPALSLSNGYRSVDYYLRQPNLYPTAKAHGFYGDHYKKRLGQLVLRQAGRFFYILLIEIVLIMISRVSVFRE